MPPTVITVDGVTSVYAWFDVPLLSLQRSGAFTFYATSTFGGPDNLIDGTTTFRNVSWIMSSDMSPGASLVITKSSTMTHFARAGDVLPYEIVARNTGYVPLINFAISDPLLPELNCEPPQPVTLMLGTTLACTGSYVVTAADVRAGYVTNTATAAGEVVYGAVDASPEARVLVRAQGTVTVPGIAPGHAGARLSLQACAIELQQDWQPHYTKLQFDVWNEDEVKFTGAFECSESWHETEFGQSIDSAQQNFTVGVLGTYGARYRVQAVTSPQCPNARATGLLGVLSMTIGAGQKTIGTTLVGAGRFTGSIRWDPSGSLPEGNIR